MIKIADKSRFYITLCAATAAGFVLCAVAVIGLMPRIMIVTKECTLDLEQTVAALEERIAAHGWVLSGGKPVNMNHSLASQGVVFEPQVRLIKLCKAEYAQSVLSTDPKVSCMMPCTISVWEGNDGKTYLSKMNMSLMAKMFGGNIGKIMGGKVSRDEEKFLEGLVK